MRDYVLKYVIIFSTLIILQILLFNHISIRINDWFFIPYVYLLGLLLLPIDTKPEVVILLGFALGLVIDLLSGTIALHTSASVFAAYLRRSILIITAPRLGYTQQANLPSYLYYGYGWFTKYAFIFVFAHHFVFYLLDIFSLRIIYVVLIKTLINSLFTLIFVLIAHYVFKNRPTVV